LVYKVIKDINLLKKKVDLKPMFTLNPFVYNNWLYLAIFVIVTQLMIQIW